MSAALRLSGRRTGYLLVVLSLLPLLVAFHQLIILTADLALAGGASARLPLLTLEVLGAVGLGVLLLYQGLRRVNG